MARLNLSLDDRLFEELTRLANTKKIAVAGIARRLLQEAVAHRRRRELHRTMAAAYAAGAKDPEELETLRALQNGRDDLLARGAGLTTRRGRTKSS